MLAWSYPDSYRYKRLIEQVVAHQRASRVSALKRVRQKTSHDEPTEANKDLLGQDLGLCNPCGDTVWDSRRDEVRAWLEGSGP